jgi:hypothetical protein
MGSFFARRFAKRCSAHLGHHDAALGARNLACQMFWDIA